MNGTRPTLPSSSTTGCILSSWVFPLVPAPWRIGSNAVALISILPVVLMVLPFQFQVVLAERVRRDARVVASPAQAGAPSLPLVLLHRRCSLRDALFAASAPRLRRLVTRQVADTSAGIRLDALRRGVSRVTCRDQVLLPPLHPRASYSARCSARRPCAIATT